MKKFASHITLYLLLLLGLTACGEKVANSTLPLTKADPITEHFKGLQFDMKSLQRPTFDVFTQSITEYGGVGDGQTDNTEAFNKAIKSISEKGGGHLTVPSGIWITGPITFENNIDLHLLDGAIILFSGDYTKYPLVNTSFEGLDTKRCISPLNAEGKTNIAITGYGTIDGNGEAWRWVKKEKLTEKAWKEYLKRGGCTNAEKTIWFPSESIREAYYKSDMNVVRNVTSDEEWAKIHDFLRPVLLSFRNCKNVLIENIQFRDSPAWCLHPLMCENVIINNVRIKNPWHSQNGDGVDIESCKNILIANSYFDVGDDAICIKSGKDEDGRRRNVPCTNIVVDKCTVGHGHGGFVVGSETSCGVKNIAVRNCMFLGTDVGLRFKSRRGRGGTVENIYIDNINMADIQTECIRFNLFYNDTDEGRSTDSIPTADETTPCFRNIFISNINCNGAKRAMFFNGLPERRILNINIKDVKIKSTYGIELSESEGIFLENVDLCIAKDQAIKLHNVDNIAAKGLNFIGEAEFGMSIDGDKCGLVEIVSNTITKENSDVTADSCQLYIGTHE